VPIHANNVESNRSKAGGSPGYSIGQQLERSPPKRASATLITTNPNQRPRLDTPPHQQPSGVKDPSALSVLAKRKGMVTRVTTTADYFSCKSCPLHFPTLESLLSHVDKEHNVENRSGGAHPCRYCPRTFHSPSLLQTHLRYHKEASLFICQFPGCEKSYYELRKLRTTRILSLCLFFLVVFILPTI